MIYPWTPLIDAAWPRFVIKVHAPDPFACWPWLGAKSRGQGNRAWYGSFSVRDGITVRAHIFAAEAAGLICEPGQHRDHLCGNTLCMNDLHMEPTSPAENSRRRWRSTPTWRRAA